MNEREKELLQRQIKKEKRIIKALEGQYLSALDLINEKIRILQSDELTQSRIYHLQYQQALKGQVQAIIDRLQGDVYTSIQQFLHDSYTDAFVGTMYSLHGQGMPLIIPIDQKQAVKAILTDSQINEGLYEALGADAQKLKKTITSEITRGIASALTYNEIAQSISNASNAPLSRAKLITRTESHRIQQEAAYDSSLEAKAHKADAVNQWCAVLDGRTRDSHRRLDGQIREVGEAFEIDGRMAKYPGGFGDPAEDCSCRCVLLTRAVAALDEEELKTLQERADFWGLDRSREFEDFKKKYLDAAEIVENAEKNLKKQGESGTIKVENSVVKSAVSSGVVSATVNANKQNRHIKDSPGYVEGRSYIYGTLKDAQRLIDDLNGTGEALLDGKGNWLRKERVHAEDPVGVHIDKISGNETKTTNGLIVYSKTGAHIYPAKEEEDEH